MLKNKLIIAILTGVGVLGLASYSLSNSPSNGKEGSVSKVQIETPEQSAPAKVQTRQFSIRKLEPTSEQVIVFDVPVTYESVEVTLDYLAQLESMGIKEAYLILNSPGGSLIDGAKLMSQIKYGTVKVNTVCDGICASMAAHLFETGKTRYMTDKSILMFHPASGGVMGTLEQMLNQLTMIKKYVDRMDAEVALRAGIDYQDFKSRLVSEYWIESEDAITEKLADSLVYFSFAQSEEQHVKVSNIFKQKNIVVPDNLKVPGVIVFDSIRLTK